MQLALDVAAESELRFRVGAVVVNRWGDWAACNVSKTHPQLKRHGYPEWSDLHAELRAVLMAGESDCKGATVYVGRLKRNGTVGLAKPCEYCMAVLVNVGVKRVVWTTESGVEEVRL